jgi:CMP/dCMP kinase
MKNFIIAIDGTSSTGKSTIAKAIAKHFNILHIDSGAMYRAITLFAVENHLYLNNKLDKEKLISLLSKIHISFHKNEHTKSNDIFLDHKNVENKIRTVEIAKKVSFVASIKEVRAYLIKIQQSFSDKKSVVMDGRDIGTMVFPDADIKLFISSSIEVRAKRRFDEMTKNGINIGLDEVKNDLFLRDEMDINRADSPLKKANDAIEIDNSFLTKEETIQTAIEIIQGKII